MKLEIPTGPIESEPRPDQAWLVRRRMALPYTDEVRALHAKEDRQILLDELAAAGVELGAYDRRQIAWLAGWETETLITIASWIKRAHAAGQPARRTKRTPGPATNP